MKRPGPKKFSNPVDEHIASRVTARRKELEISMQELGDGIGVTFQMIGKYEHGKCRLSASRLWDVSRVLNVPVSYFFEGITVA